jgi:hypothetical protein
MIYGFNSASSRRSTKEQPTYAFELEYHLSPRIHLKVRRSLKEPSASEEPTALLLRLRLNQLLIIRWPARMARLSVMDAV